MSNAPCKIQDTAAWTDPLVQETLACLGDAGEINGGGDANDQPLIKVLLETDSLDPLTVATALCDGQEVHRASLPPPVRDMLELVSGARLRDEGAAHLFAGGGSPTALRLILAEISMELTGAGFDDIRAQVTKNPPKFKVFMDKASENFIALADGLLETGLWKEISPKLLDRFVECVQNLSTLVESPSRRKVMTSAISGLKAEVALATAQEITETSPPRIDPSSQYEVMKNVAKTKYRLGH